MKTIYQFSLALLTSCFFFFTSCSESNCDDTMCMNGGVCLEGTCDCPDNFTGPNCDEQVTPDKVRFRTIQVTRFPATDGDAMWDEADGPDLYFRLYKGDEPLAQPIIDMQNADANQDYFFFIEIIDVRDAFAEYRLELRDYDPDDADDVLGEVKFTPYQSSNGFPASMILDNGGAVAFNVELEYIYNKD